MKEMIVSICFLLSILLSSCSSSNLIESDVDESKLNAIPDVVMRTENSNYPIDVSEVKLIFENQTDQETSFGERFFAQILVNDVWKTIPFTATGGDFILRANVLPASGNTQLTIKLNRLDFKVKPGKYRIIMDVGYGDHPSLSAEFTVGD